MLNKLWAGMLLTGLVVALFTGRLAEVTNAAIDSSREAVALCLTMIGLMAMWTGLMKIAERSGLVDTLADGMSPMLCWLFPDLPRKCAAMRHISANMIANILGLGWAATPAGIKAMQEMQKLNPRKDEASRSMCMFMIINMSSLQIVTMSIIAYRAQYDSINPAEVIAPGFLVTIITTIIGVLFAKVCEKRGRHRV